MNPVDSVMEIIMRMKLNVCVKFQKLIKEIAEDILYFVIESFSWELIGKTTEKNMYSFIKIGPIYKVLKFVI